MLIFLSSCNSGQTGSPADYHPPAYDSPAPAKPAVSGGGSEISVGGEGGSDQVLPNPPGTPGQACIVDGLLVVAGPNGVTFYEATNSPEVRGRWTIRGSAGLLRCDSRSRLVLVVTEAPAYSGSAIPSDPIAYSQQRLVEIDATDVSQPQTGKSFVLPKGTAAVLPAGEGYALLGSTSDPAEPPCGSSTSLGMARVELIRGIWIKRYEVRGDQLVQVSERQLAPGQWHIAQDQAHAIYLGTGPDVQPRAPFAVEIVDLTTLESSFRADVSSEDLGSPLPRLLGADYADRVLLLAAGSQILGWETEGGSALLPMAMTEPVQRVTYLRGGDFAALTGGGDGLLRIDRAQAPPRISQLAFPTGGIASTSIALPLQPFHDGFLRVTTTGPKESQRLALTRYSLNAAGALGVIDQLETTPFTNFWIDPDLERITYASQNDDLAPGQLAIVDMHTGQLGRSNLVAIDSRATASVGTTGTLYAVSDYSVQPVSVDSPEDSATKLLSGASLSTALEGVRFELDHAGLLWTLHRANTGATSLRVRATPFGETTLVALPHEADAIVPVDASHVVVFGFSATAPCDTDLTPQKDAMDLPEHECAQQKGNGISVLSVHATADGPGVAQISATFPLSSALAGTPPDGVDQKIDWSGYFPIASARWAVVGSLTQACHSEANCETIGAKPYHSTEARTPPGCTGAKCPATQAPDPATPTESISGYHTETRLFVLNLEDPDHPAFGAAAGGGARSEMNEADGWNVAGYLFQHEEGGATLRGYASYDPIYNDEGDSLVDAQGRAIIRNYLQVIGDAGGTPRFEDKVNVPGTPVLLTGATPGGDGIHTAFTLEPTYRQNGEQHMQLHRVHIERAGAVIEETIDVGTYVDAIQAGEGRLAVLRLPADSCATDADSDMIVIDVEGTSMKVSSRLTLAQSRGYGWQFSPRMPPAKEPGVVYVYGGPAGNRGRLVVDITTDPPAIVRYETFRD